jgi:GTP pyrophosphokinase
MIRLNDITSLVLGYFPKADTQLIEKAYVYSAKVHLGQVRLSGEPYLSHALEAAYILAQMKMDVVCVAAGLLHDTLEDTAATPEEIERLFGRETLRIVEGVTKISKLNFSSATERQAENVRKMILAMAEDIRVILVKLADRLHNMRTLGFQTPEKQRRIAEETLEIYAPIAGRMGIYWMKSNLEDLCLYYLEPSIYELIQTTVAKRRDESERFINEVIALINEKSKEWDIRCTVKGRHKHFYSIYRKMKEQNLEVSQVFDILAFRIIVETVRDCYAVLGHVHSMWKPVQGRFKDYISVPKQNMYQSLHTTVIGPYGQRMEIQIRTWEMDRVAEEGIAAHWRYKEGGVSGGVDEKQLGWVKQLMEWQQNLKDPAQFLESVRMDLFPNDVYVFTPKGDVKEFPLGATPIDFAYSIHSEVGEHCSGAKVNGRMVPLRYKLKNGDIVEIITSPKAHPSKDWLGFVMTPRAKTKIRQWVQAQERAESIRIGKDLLERFLHQEHIAIANLTKSEQLAAVAKEFSFRSPDDLLAQVGLGRISARQVFSRLKSKVGKEEERPARLMEKVVGLIRRRKEASGIVVTGVSDMLTRYAQCCRPVPGDRVVGFLTRGRGVSVHREACPTIMNADPERLVDVVWQPAPDEVYPVVLRVTSIERKGVLADVSAVITQKDANIARAEIKTTMDRKGVSHFTVEVKDLKQLQEIMAAIKKVKDILIVERL